MSSTEAPVAKPTHVLRYVTLPVFQCIRCHHKWVPEYNIYSDKFKESTKCPKCSSSLWNVPYRR
jgi:DNA replicative helicase MCM subunit Mcm2 (Cdc46/Mcm family)